MFDNFKTWEKGKHDGESAAGQQGLEMHAYSYIYGIIQIVLYMHLRNKTILGAKEKEKEKDAYPPSTISSRHKRMRSKFSSASLFSTLPLRQAARK